MGKFSKRLKEMNERYETAKESTQGVPEGKYTLQIQSCEIKESGSEKLYVLIEYLVMDGDYEGEVIRSTQFFENDVGLRILCQWIEQLGFELPDDIADLEDIIEQIADAAPMINATVKPNDDYAPNVYIDELLEEEDAETGDDAEGEEEQAEEEEDGAEEEEEEGEEEETPDDSLVGQTIIANDDGLEYTVVEVAEDGTLTVENEDGDRYDVANGDYEIVQGEEEEEEQAEEEEEDGAEEEEEEGEEASEDDSDEDIREFAIAAGFEIDESIATEDLIVAMKKETWKEAELEPDEIELLGQYDIKVTKAKKAPAKKAAANKATEKPAAKKSPEKKQAAKRTPAKKASKKKATRRK